MKIFHRKYKKHHIWLGGLVVFFVLFFLLRQSRAVMNFLAFSVVRPVMQFVARLCAATEISVAEVLLFSSVWAVLWYIIRQIRKRRFAALLVTLVEIAATVGACALLLWGSFYGADGFQQNVSSSSRDPTRVPA